MFSSTVVPDRLASATAFARAAQTYWTEVFPQVSRELGRWRERAQEIPDPVLRGLALDALAKRGNVEGAAAFATFAPGPQRTASVRAAVAFQSAYNHLDALSEQPSREPRRNSHRLHEALLAALDPSAPSLDYYEYHDSHAGRGDGGYLTALVTTCRESLKELPSYAAVNVAALRSAERVVCFQEFNSGSHEAMESWGREQTPVGSDLHWWETAAACGSSLGVHVMIAAAADPGIEPEQVRALERAYFPWIGGLHSMLDHLIDVDEDVRAGQRNLLHLYASPEESVERMRLLAEGALVNARTIAPARRHELILAAMASFYLSAPQASVGEASVVTQAVLDVFGPLARPALAIFKGRRAAERVYYACREHGRKDRRAPSLTIAAGHR